ncbi:MAG: porphobilinogen synthase [Alphaproteobacteria bacterium]|nr:MAG: porphobilinogen synthase [Alphaproteobacteria bacterium]
MFFPHLRLRRARQSPWIREILQEVSLRPADLIYPIFIRDDHIAPSIPGLGANRRYTLKELPALIREVSSLGIKAVALFPMVDKSKRDETGSYACNPEGLIPQAISIIKKTTDQLGVITDVALDPYTSHGQDGLVKKGEILNDETVAALQQMSIVLAQAGSDIVAPSDMMDGRIGAIREALDSKKFSNTMILAYTAKYASSLYGPFREAVGSKGCLGVADKKTYQMSPDRRKEALLEANQDAREGADFLMVKPATLYQDIIQNLTLTQKLPVFGYHVSGEYAMLISAHEAGFLDFGAALIETLTSIKRAGAQAILTYGACEAARILNT